MTYVLYFQYDVLRLGWLPVGSLVLWRDVRVRVSFLVQGDRGCYRDALPGCMAWVGIGCPCAARCMRWACRRWSALSPDRLCFAAGE